jgi:GNAT superfamily N-acetyltransferase
MNAELVRDDDDLRAIFALQRENLISALTPDQAAREGFVTVSHTLDDLRAMHALAPSLIVRDGPALAGYALTMPLACQDLIPILRPMFRQFGSITHRGRPLLDHRLYVMGQICVAPAHRGRGVFATLYRGHADAYGPTHDLVVTEISSRNTRSLRAHARVGFVELGRHEDGDQHWSMVGWDFRDP